MKTNYSINTLLAVSSFFATATIAFAQGSLTPPGAPAPIMKSLDQIEARTPISYAGFVITSPGSYYLTTNLTGFSSVFSKGITISSGNVTLDLNGFTVQGVSGSASGIYISGAYTNIVVRNGIVTGWGGNGVTWNYPTLPAPQNIVLEHLIVTANSSYGIAIANGCVVSECSVLNNQNIGIFVDGDNSLIIGNTLVGNNVANSSSWAGISIVGSNNRIEGNHVTGSGAAGYGIYIINYGTSLNNIIIRNSVAGGGANNYSIAPGNDLGPVGSAATATSPWANISH